MRVMPRTASLTLEGGLDVRQEQREDRAVVALEERGRHEQEQEQAEVDSSRGVPARAVRRRLEVGGSSRRRWPSAVASPVALSAASYDLPRRRASAFSLRVLADPARQIRRQRSHRWPKVPLPQRRVDGRGSRRSARVRRQGRPRRRTRADEPVITDVPFGEGTIEAHMDTSSGEMEMDGPHRGPRRHGHHSTTPRPRRSSSRATRRRACRPSWPARSRSRAT